MSKVLTHTQLTDTLGLTECTNGFWLYDKTRGMNLAMRKDTESEAFTSALEYYQRRLAEKEHAYKELASKVDAFVSQFCEDDDDWW